MQLRPITLIGIVLSMVSGIALGISGYHRWLDYRGESPESQTFDEVLNQVHASYVNEVDRHTLVSNALRACDLLVSIGTSAVVYPAADMPLVAKHVGATLVEINPEPTPMSSLYQHHLRGPASEMLLQMAEGLELPPA